MKLPESALELITPESKPPRELTPGDVLATAEHIDNKLLRQSYLWATAINTLLMHKNKPAPHQITHLSSGFVHLGDEASYSSLSPSAGKEKLFKDWQQSQPSIVGGFTFGGYVLVSGKEEHLTSRQIDFVEVGGKIFPIITVFGKTTLHSPPHPHTGTGTCWAKTTSPSATWKKGILTCRHTVDHLTIGDTVALHRSAAYISPAFGVLAEYNACTIDAAFVEIAPSDWPPGLTRLAAKRPLSPGSNVNFSGRISGPTSGKVLRVFQYGNYFGNMFGQRIVADCFGKHGDSGALLKTKHGDGAGIYMGTIPDGAGGSDGIYQDLAQVQDFFNVKLYE